ncbi:MAG: hypothetical protein WBV94_03965 [Blastocatellia bacterium]
MVIYRTEESDDKDMSILDEPNKFYEQAFSHSRNRAADLAAIVGQPATTVEKWFRPVESDENPTATGRRSDFARFVDVITRACDPFHLDLIEEVGRALIERANQGRANLARLQLDQITDLREAEGLQEKIGERVKTLRFDGAQPK